MTFNIYKMDNQSSNQAPSKEDLSKKLRQKMKTQRLQRQSNDVQRSFLEKAKVPENMMDKALQALKQKTPHAGMLQQMITQMAALQSQVAPQMRPPTVDPSLKEESGKEESGKEESGKEESGKEESGKDESSKDESSKDESSKDVV
jgi:ribosomal protein L16 Arg81 hydroxylase